MSLLTDILTFIPKTVSSWYSMGDMLSGGPEKRRKEDFEMQKALNQQQADLSANMSENLANLQLEHSKNLTTFNNQQTLDMQKQQGQIALNNMLTMGQNPAMMGGQPQTVASANSSAGAPVMSAPGNLVDSYLKGRELEIQDKLANAQIAKTHAEIENLGHQNTVNDSQSAVNVTQSLLNLANQENIEVNTKYALDSYLSRLQQLGLINEQIKADTQRIFADTNRIDADAVYKYIASQMTVEQKDLLIKENENYQRRADDEHNESVSRQSVNSTTVQKLKSDISVNAAQIDFMAASAEERRATAHRISELTPHEKYLIKRQGITEYMRSGLTYNQAEYISNLALNADSERALIQAQKEATEMGTTLAPINTAIGAFSAGASGYQSIKTGQFLDGKTSGVRPQIGFNVQ